MRISHGTRIARHRDFTTDSDGPTQNATRTWTSSRGVWLRLEAQQPETGRPGTVPTFGWGEASPLPGYSPDSLAQVEADLDTWLGRLPLEVEPQRPTPRQLEALVGHLPHRSPSAVFAIETAILDLIGQVQEQPLAQLIGGWLDRPPATEIALARLISAADPDTAELQAQASLDAGVQCLKLKIGRPGAFNQELESLDRIRALGGASLAIRLDANRSLAADQLASQLAALAVFSPEFIEEPSQPEAFAVLSGSPVPVAADETLQSPDAWQLLAPLVSAGTLSTLILKPTVLGGFGACLRWARIAEENGLDWITSHTFEGTVGWSACAALALCQPHRLAAGLGDHSGLETVPSPPGLSAGRLVATDRPGIGWRPQP